MRSLVERAARRDHRSRAWARGPARALRRGRRGARRSKLRRQHRLLPLRSHGAPAVGHGRRVGAHGARRRASRWARRGPRAAQAGAAGPRERFGRGPMPVPRPTRSLLDLRGPAAWVPNVSLRPCALRCAGSEGTRSRCAPRTSGDRRAPLPRIAGGSTAQALARGGEAVSERADGGGPVASSGTL